MVARAKYEFMLASRHLVYYRLGQAVPNFDPSSDAVSKFR
jgi:hypothetical protein